MREYLKYVIVGLAYYSVIILASLFYFLDYNNSSLSQAVFLFYDSVHYHSIAEQGYVSQYEVAFFPLFPFTWKLAGLSLSGISILNSTVYIFCAALLAKAEKLNIQNYLIILALPSAVFYFIPYSEAFYFACCFALLYGIKQNKFAIEIAGIILCCFCRPVIPVLLPCVLLFSFYEKATFYKTIIRGGSVFAGTFLAFFVHWIYTGNFLSYLSAFNTWDYNFKFPLLPLKSGGGDMIMHTDGYALLFGLLSVICVVICLKNRAKGMMIKKYEFFSIAYISFFTLLILGLMRGGNLTSLNRFIYCSPFFIITFFYIEDNFIRIKSMKNFGLLFLGVVILGLFFSSYVHIQTFLRYLVVALIFSIYFAKKHFVINKINIEKTAIFILLVVLQLAFVNKFLNGQWIG